MEQLLVEFPISCSGKDRFLSEMRKLEWNLPWGMVLDGDEVRHYEHL